MKQQPEVTQERKTPISDDIENQRKLTRLVTACYEGLNVYGKSPEQLEAVIMLMQMTLGEYTYPIVRRGFERHLKESATMPTPHDIIKLIKKIDIEEQESFYRPDIRLDKEMELIHKLGLAHQRRKMGITRNQQWEIHDLLESWEKENDQKVDWENIGEWKLKRGRN